MTLKVAPGGVVNKVAWLHFNDRRQVLFARSRGQILSYTVGGKINPGETHEEALVREVKEETDVDIIAESIKFYFMFEGPCHGYVEGTKLRMWCFTADFVGTLVASNEIEELVYLGDYDIGKKRTTAMGDTILDHLTMDNLLGRQQYSGL